jgi:hypothetical protein
VTNALWAYHNPPKTNNRFCSLPHLYVELTLLVLQKYITIKVVADPRTLQFTQSRGRPTHLTFTQSRGRPTQLTSLLKSWQTHAPYISLKVVADPRIIHLLQSRGRPTHYMSFKVVADPRTVVSLNI